MLRSMCTSFACPVQVGEKVIECMSQMAQERWLEVDAEYALRPPAESAPGPEGKFSDGGVGHSAKDVGSACSGCARRPGAGDVAAGRPLGGRSPKHPGNGEQTGAQPPAKPSKSKPEALCKGGAAHGAPGRPAGAISLHAHAGGASECRAPRSGQAAAGHGPGLPRGDCSTGQGRDEGRRSCSERAGAGSGPALPRGAGSGADGRGLGSASRSSVAAGCGPGLPCADVGAGGGGREGRGCAGDGKGGSSRADAPGDREVGTRSAPMACPLRSPAGEWSLRDGTGHSDVPMGHAKVRPALPVIQLSRVASSACTDNQGAGHIHTSFVLL